MTDTNPKFINNQGLLGKLNLRKKKNTSLKTEVIHIWAMKSSKNIRFYEDKGGLLLPEELANPKTRNSAPVYEGRPDSPKRKPTCISNTRPSLGKHLKGTEWVLSSSHYAYLGRSNLKMLMEYGLLIVSYKAYVNYKSATRTRIDIETSFRIINPHTEKSAPFKTSLSIDVCSLPQKLYKKISLGKKMGKIITFDKRASRNSITNSQLIKTFKVYPKHLKLNHLRKQVMGRNTKHNTDNNRICADGNNYLSLKISRAVCSTPEYLSNQSTSPSMSNSRPCKNSLRIRPVMPIAKRNVSSHSSITNESVNSNLKRWNWWVLPMFKFGHGRKPSQWIHMQRIERGSTPQPTNKHSGVNLPVLSSPIIKLNRNFSFMNDEKKAEKHSSFPQIN